MDLVFKAGSDIVNVKIIGRKIYFKKIINGSPVLLEMSKINLPIEGILNKWPDLNGKPSSEIKKEGAERLDRYISEMKSEEEVKNYVIKELEILGCKLVSIVKPGFRPVIIHKNLE